MSPADDPFGLFSSPPAPFSKSAAAPKPTVASDVPLFEATFPATLPPSKQAHDVAPTSPRNEAATGGQIPSDLDALVARLVDIGFDREQSRQALIMHNGNLEAAAESILHQQSSVNGQGNSTPSSASDAAMVDRLARLGLSAKQAEKAGKLVNSAGRTGLSIFNKAKSLMADTTKKVSAAIVEQRRGGNDGRVNASRDRFGSDDNDGMWTNNGGGSGSVGSSQEDVVVSGAVSAATVAAAKPIHSTAPLKKKRPEAVVTATAAQLAQCETFKEQGNTFFRQGQYGDAEACYSRSIAALPSSHLQLVPILNNRAAARLKTGNYKECLGDCTAVEEMCTRELDYDDVSESQQVDYRDAIAKALLRRATAYEAMEKWDEAGRDYRKAVEWNAGAKGAAEGILRCGKALARAGRIEREDRERTAAVAGEFPGGGSTPAFDSFDPFAGNKATAKSTPTTTGTGGLADLAFMTAPAAPRDGGAGPKMPAPKGPVPVPSGSRAPAAEFKSERVEAMRQKEQQTIANDAAKLAVKDQTDAKVCESALVMSLHERIPHHNDDAFATPARSMVDGQEAKCTSAPRFLGHGALAGNPCRLETGQLERVDYATAGQNKVYEGHCEIAS